MDSAGIRIAMDDRSDLRALADDIDRSRPVRHAELSARETTCALAGVMSWVARRSSVQTMQQAAAQLVRHDSMWSSGAAGWNHLPNRDGSVDIHIAMIAAVACGLYPIASMANIRRALAFWAVESDTAQWHAMIAAA
jgi:hypothetical protein